MSYSFRIQLGIVTRDSDGRQIVPADGPDYGGWLAGYEAWLAAGNTPTVVLEPVQFDPAAYQSECIVAIQALLDATTQARGFDGILSAATYVGSAVQRFHDDGTALRNWRDACWSYGYQALAEVQGGLRALPTVEELVAELPAIVG